MQGRYNVLFLCTGNSARSIMAEAILNGKGRPVFTGHSAGSYPLGAVRPEALKLIELAHLPTEGLRSKSWEEFAKAEAPKRRRWILSSLFATTRRRKCVRYGRASL